MLQRKKIPIKESTIITLTCSLNFDSTHLIIDNTEVIEFIEFIELDSSNVCKLNDALHKIFTESLKDYYVYMFYTPCYKSELYFELLNDQSIEGCKVYKFRGFKKEN